MGIGSLLSLDYRDCDGDRNKIRLKRQMGVQLCRALNVKSIGFYLIIYATGSHWKFLSRGGWRCALRLSIQHTYRGGFGEGREQEQRDQFGGHFVGPGKR